MSDPLRSTDSTVNKADSRDVSRRNPGRGESTPSRANTGPEIRRGRVQGIDLIYREGHPPIIADERAGRHLVAPTLRRTRRERSSDSDDTGNEPAVKRLKSQVDEDRRKVEVREGRVAVREQQVADKERQANEKMAQAKDMMAQANEKLAQANGKIAQAEAQERRVIDRDQLILERERRVEKQLQELDKEKKRVQEIPEARSSDFIANEVIKLARETMNLNSAIVTSHREENADRDRATRQLLLDQREENAKREGTTRQLLLDQQESSREASREQVAGFEAILTGQNRDTIQWWNFDELTVRTLQTQPASSDTTSIDQSFDGPQRCQSGHSCQTDFERPMQCSTAMSSSSRATSKAKKRQKVKGEKNRPSLYVKSE